MFVKAADAYNRERRRCAVHVDLVYICYVLSAESRITHAPLPVGSVGSLDDARRWVNGEAVAMLPLVTGGEC